METTSAQAIKVVIIEDLRHIREGLATMINFTDGFGFGMNLQFFVNALNVKRNRMKGNPEHGSCGFL